MPRLSDVTISVAASLPDGNYNFVSSGSTVDVNLAGGTWTVTDVDALLAMTTAARLADGTTTAASSALSDVQLTGVVRLAEPPEGVSVPAASLVEGANGWCIAVDAGSGNLDTVPVTLTGSDFAGAALLGAAVRPGTRVLVNPESRDVTCP